LKIMNSNETEICKLKDKEEFSWEKDLIIPLFVTSVIVFILFNLPDIVGSLNFINPLWKDGLEEIIKQAFSHKYVLVSFIILLIIIFILSSIIWPIFRRSKIRLKIIKLLEKELDKRTQRSESQITNVTNNFNFGIGIADTIGDSKKSTYFNPTPDKHSGPETKNYTGHTMPIDSGKIEIPDIANDTVNPHNEDQK